MYERLPACFSPTPQTRSPLRNLPEFSSPHLGLVTRRTRGWLCPLSLRVVTRLAGGGAPPNSCHRQHTLGPAGPTAWLSLNGFPTQSFRKPVFAEDHKSNKAATRYQSKTDHAKQRRVTSAAQITTGEQEFFFLCTLREGGKLVCERLPACFSPTPQT